MTGLEEERACEACGAAAKELDRFCRMCGAALAIGSGQEEVRRYVVVLFADLEGFTAMSQRLDPELLRAVLNRYFRLAAQVVWSYGGVTEKFIGDAVMAVFGLPLVREDDAIRAVRAAGAIVAQVEKLNVELDREYGIQLVVRIAVHAGPVSASYDSSGAFRVVGDAVNTASRLQSTAQPRQVLVGEPVAEAVRSQVELEAVAPLSLRGKEAPVRAWRLLSSEPSSGPPQGASLVGRDVELLQLRQTFDRTVQRGRAATVALFGPPGIGKSRLAAEFLASLEDRPAGVLSGHATSYGQGMTYRPIVKMLESAPEAWTGFALAARSDATLARAQACLARLGIAADVAGPPAEVSEIAWALCTLVDFAAQSGWVLLQWEDLHWAEPALLDVIEYIADQLTDAPVMQLCLARPELLDIWPTGLQGHGGTLNLELSPLTADEMAALVAELSQRYEVSAQGSDETCALVASACEGNPLFAELMLDVAGSHPAHPMPRTIQALFAARLDQLHVNDRLILEMAAVVGRDFTIHDVEYLLRADERADVDLNSSLDRLRRARLVTGSRLAIRHSFAQAFGRDTAYEMTAKRDRLRWHMALADRAEPAAVRAPPRAAEPRGADLLPYHLEAALELTRDLHPNSPSIRDLGVLAGAALAELAVRAMDREDLQAAAGLFERAIRAQPTDDTRGSELAIRLSDTWLGMGDRARAQAALTSESRIGETPIEVEIQRELIDLRHGLRTPSQVLAEEQRIEPQLGDGDRAWCRFLQLRAHRHLMDERLGAAEASFTAALARAVACGDSYQQRRILRTATQLALWGPTPVPEGLARCRALADQYADSREPLVTILATTGGLLAFDGRLEEAREQLTTATGYAADLRMRGADVALAHVWGVLESIADDHRAAAAHFRRARSALSEGGHATGVALLDAHVARELVVAGEPVPAPYQAMTDDDVASISDLRTGAMAAGLCARAAVVASDVDRAMRLAALARSLAERMEDPFFQGTISRDIAATLNAADRLDEALAAATTAQERYRAKGVRALLPRTSQLVSQLACALGREGSC